MSLTKHTRNSFVVDLGDSSRDCTYANYVKAFKFYHLSATYYRNRLLMVII